MNKINHILKGLRKWADTQPPTLNKYQISAIIGLYRMGNNEAVISAFMNCEIWEVNQTIRLYFISK